MAFAEQELLEALNEEREPIEYYQQLSDEKEGNALEVNRLFQFADDQSLISELYADLNGIEEHI